MTTLFGTLGVLILIVGSAFLFAWKSELSKKRFIQKMNKRFEQLEKHLEESGNQIGADHNSVQAN